jgi:hypothetical protein
MVAPGGCGCVKLIVVHSGNVLEGVPVGSWPSRPAGPAKYMQADRYFIKWFVCQCVSEGDGFFHMIASGEGEGPCQTALKSWTMQGRIEDGTAWLSELAE